MSLDEKQLALRRTGVTGTDVPAILGLSLWRTGLDVWLDKKGQAPPFEPTEDTERGTFLEDGGRRWYSHRTGARVKEVGTVVCPRNALVIATPDGIAHLPDGDERVLEIKMPSHAGGWGEPGTDAVPEYYLPQVAWELAATLKETADVFAVLDGKPRLYHVRRDQELEGLLVEEMERWWRDYVVADKPPPVAGRDSGTISKWMRRHEGEAMLDFATLSPEAQVTLEECLRAYAEESAALERLVLWEARAKMVLGSAPGVQGLPEELGFSRIDWRVQKGRLVTDWEGLARRLFAQPGLMHAQFGDLVREHTTMCEGNRPFTPRPLKKGSK